MNIYDSLKLAARKGWKLDFDPDARTVTVRARRRIKNVSSAIATQRWHTMDGIVTPVTATIRAIREAEQACSS